MLRGKTVALILSHYSSGQLIRLLNAKSLETVYERKIQLKEMRFVFDGPTESTDRYLFLPLKLERLESRDGYFFTHLAVVNIPRREMSKLIAIPSPGKQVTIENLEDRLLFVFNL